MSSLRPIKQLIRTLQRVKLARNQSTSGKYQQNVHQTEQTLTGRIISYLNYNKDNTSISKSLRNLRALDNHTINIKDLRSCIKLAGDPKILPNLDEKCCHQLAKLTPQETCDLLHSFAQTIPNSITTLNFYKQAIMSLHCDLDKLNKDELIQFIFFTGLQKKTKQAQTILKRCQQQVTSFLGELDSNQLCIICNSIFKTSTKANEKILTFVAHYINTNLLILTDPALFITFVKLIRQNKYQTDELLTNISCAIFFNKTARFYSMTAMCHILALYADYLYYDKNLFDCFVAKCLEELKEPAYNPELTHLLGQARVKDINRLIWCLAQINYQNLGQEQTKDLVLNVIKRVEQGECDKDPDMLVEIFLNLWLMNYRAYELVPFTFIRPYLLKLADSNSPFKKRLNLLLTLIYYEDEKLYDKINLEPARRCTYSAELQFGKRPVLQRVVDCLKNVGKYHEVNRFEVGCQIPHLNIVGITGYKKKIYKAVHIEVLDEHTMVKNTDSLASGLMQTKIRILDRMEEGLIVVDANEISDMTEYDLQQYLEESINLVT